jgi:hypothetical protein
MKAIHETIDRIHTQWTLNDIFRGYLHNKEHLDIDNFERDLYEKKIAKETDALKKYAQPILDKNGQKRPAPLGIEKTETRPITRKVPKEILDLRLYPSTFTFVLRGTRDTSESVPAASSEYTTISFVDITDTSIGEPEHIMFEINPQGAFWMGEKATPYSLKSIHAVLDFAAKELAG